MKNQRPIGITENKEFETSSDFSERPGVASPSNAIADKSRQERASHLKCQQTPFLPCIHVQLELQTFWTIVQDSRSDERLSRSFISPLCLERAWVVWVLYILNLVPKVLAYFHFPVPALHLR